MFALTEEQIIDATKMAQKPDLPNFSLAGTGKTHTTLEAIRLTGFKTGIILCPTIALHWWKSQADMWLDIESHIVRTSKEKLPSGILIMTYDIARRRFVELYHTFSGGFLVMDESHHVASPLSQRSKSLFGPFLDGHGGLTACFDTVWCLTGTPICNYANDLWTQVGVLHPGAFRSRGIRNYNDFERKFCVKREVKYTPTMRPKWVVKGNVQEMLLHKIVYDEIGAIRRLSPPDGLPELNMRDLCVDVSLSRDDREASKDFKISDLTDPDSMIAKVWRTIGLLKVKPTASMIKDLCKSGPILLGCWHRDVMDEYEAELSGLKVVQVHGGTPDSKLEGIGKRFNRGHYDVLIGQMKKMGVSWNLQEASNRVIVAETHPSPGIVEQFYKRVYRRGQKRPCYVDIITSETDVDKGLNKVRRKKEASNEVINQMET